MSTGATAAPVGAPARAPRVAGVDVPVALTEWPEMTTLRLDSIAAALRGSTIVDAPNVLSPGGVSEAGLTHLGVGRR